MPPAKIKRDYYAPELKAQMVELMRSGRTPTMLFDEFGVQITTLATWMWRARIKRWKLRRRTSARSWPSFAGCAKQTAAPRGARR